MAAPGLFGRIGPRAAIAAFGIFLAFVLLFGGASRADVLSQFAVRLAAALLIGWFIFAGRTDQLREVRAPALFVFALTVLMAVQLIPLPTETWRSLPGREPFVSALRMAGVETGWHPISLAPDRTMNSVAAMLPPLAAVLGMAMVGREGDRILLNILLSGIAFSLLIGIVQVGTGDLYFYRITNQGSAVGVFSNRNHHALLIAAAFPLLAGWALLPVRHARTKAIRLWIALCAGAAVFPFLLITGSRAGLILGIVGLIAAIAIFLIKKAERRGRLRWKRGAVFMLPLAIGLVAVMLFAFSGRNAALSRIFLTSRDELRSEVLPILLRMAQDFFPFGAGFGSFDPVYRVYEPHAFLDSTYLNHAHNDAVELVIEGGLPALLVAIFFLLWFLARSVRLWVRKGGGTDQLLGRVGSAVIGMILVGSLVDYPLRTPILAVVFVIAFCWMARPLRESSLEEEAPVSRGRRRASSGARAEGERA